jgi:hypothetical protein
MDFTLVLLSGETWFKLNFLMLSHGMPSHVQIGVCCPLSATRIFGPIYFLIPRIHADFTHKKFVFVNTCSIAIEPVPIAGNRSFLTYSFLYRVLNS